MTENIDVKIIKEIQQAKQFALRKNEKAAILCLKRKKIYDNQKTNLEGAGLTIETQIASIEGATTNFAILDAMTQGAKALKGINRHMNVDEVEDTMEDIRTQMEVADEIGIAVATPLGGLDVVDDAELQEELNQLMEEDLNQAFENIEVPREKLSSDPVQHAATEEEEFAALGADMGFEV